MATVRKVKDSYQIIVSCGYDVSGKQIRQYMTYTPEPGITPGKLKKELEKVKQEFETSVKNGQSLNSGVKFETLAREWLQDKKIEGIMKPLTIERYEQLQKRTYAALGHKKISDIHFRDVKNFIFSLSESGLSTKTQSLYLCFISDVFKYAILCGYVAVNPCERVSTVKKPPKEREVYTPEEAAQFLKILEEAAPIHYKAYFSIAIFLGLRNGEILGLEWKDIDFDNKILSINRTSLQQNGKGMITGTPKTSKSIRKIAIPESLAVLLQQYKAAQAAERLKCGDRWVNTDRLFTAWNGEPMGPNTARHWLKKFDEKHGLRYVTIHSFRHLCASLLIANGTNIKSVSSILGHSQTSTTLNIYSHSFAEVEAAAIQELENELKGKAAQQ